MAQQISGDVVHVGQIFLHPRHLSVHVYWLRLCTSKKTGVSQVSSGGTLQKAVQNKI